MSNYKSIECGDIEGKVYSKKLSGALSTNQDFFYLVPCNGEFEFLYSSVSSFVPDDIIIDYGNDIFIGKYGAVHDAYDFSKLTDKERAKAIEEILTIKKMMYPDCEFIMVPGRFPLGVSENGSDAIMSTHILYITNYKMLLEAKKTQLNTNLF